MDLGKTLASTLAAGHIQGMAEVLASVPARVAKAIEELPEDVPEENALIDLAGDSQVHFPAIDDSITVLRSRPLFNGADYRQTAEAVREGAFAITSDLADEAVADVRDLLAEHFNDPQGFEEAVAARLVDVGPLSPARLDTIFRAVVGKAVSDGQETALDHPVVGNSLPYRRYFATKDHRVRPEHLALESCGLNGSPIYNANDIVWNTFRPPWQYNCRCSFTPMTPGQAAAKGVQEAVEWLARAKQMADDKGGSHYQYLDQTSPVNPQTVPWPTLDGKRIQPDPEFRR